MNKINKFIRKIKKFFINNVNLEEQIKYNLKQGVWVLYRNNVYEARIRSIELIYNESHPVYHVDTKKPNDFTPWGCYGSRTWYTLVGLKGDSVFLTEDGAISAKRKKEIKKLEKELSKLKKHE
jgi:hypothetical protein